MSKCCENSVREAAYYLWQNAGCPCGQDEYFWALAIEQVGVKNSKTCATSTKKTTMKKPSTTTTKKATSTTKKATSAPAKKA